MPASVCALGKWQWNKCSRWPTSYYLGRFQWNGLASMKRNEGKLSSSQDLFSLQGLHNLTGTTDLFMKGWMGQILPWFLHYCEEINLRNSGSQRFKFSLFWQVMTCLGITGYTLDTSELWSQHCVNLEKGIRDRKVIRTPERKAGQIFSIYENGDLCFVQMLLRQNRECLCVWEGRLWRKSKTYSNNNILRKTAKCYPCSAEEYYYQ